MEDRKRILNFYILGYKCLCVYKNRYSFLRKWQNNQINKTKMSFCLILDRFNFDDDFDSSWEAFINVHDVAKHNTNKTNIFPHQKSFLDSNDVFVLVCVVTLQICDSMGECGDKSSNVCRCQWVYSSDKLCIIIITISLRGMGKFYISYWQIQDKLGK